MRKVFLISLILGFNLFASQTRFISSDDKDNFYDGGVQENVGVNNRGELSLSPKLKEYASLPSRYVWDLDFRNGSVVAATGHNGMLYIVSDNEETKEIKLDTPDISAIFVKEDGTILAAGMPEAMIFEIKTNYEVSVIKYFTDAYVWDIVTDGKTNYFALGGKEASVYTLTESGFASYLSIGENHITCLHYDKDKNRLLAGTEGRGLLIEIIASNKYNVLAEVPEVEVHAIAQNGSDIFFATAGRERSYKDEEEENNNGGGDKKARPLKNAIYKLDNRGTITRMFYFNETVILSLAFSDGFLYAGSGDEGKLYKINPTTFQIERIAKIDEGQILCLKNSDNQIIAGTGTSAKLYTLSVGYASEGEYTSEVFDTYNVSKWGKIYTEKNVEKGTSLSFQTRTGNVSMVDQTWSEFTPLSKEDKIESPPARFIQFKAIFSTEDEEKTPIINSLRLSYVNYNMVPEVYDIDLVTGASQKNTGVQSRKKPTLNDDESMFTWESYDANGDSLTYKVEYRREGESIFKLLEENLRDTYYIFETKKLPSAVYELKVTASDMYDNSDEEAKSAFAISKPMLLDHTAPNIKKIAFENNIVSFYIEDDFSVIKSVRYSLDGGDWRYVLPKDGMLDDKAEYFEITNISAEVMSIEVYDSKDNSAYYPFIMGKQ